jgi:hypothetical protein
LGSAVSLGLVAAIWFVGPLLLVLVALQALCAIGYPLATWFGGALHRDSIFAISWGSLPFLTSFYAQARTLTSVSLLVAAIFAAVALLEIRLSRTSRRLREVSRATVDPGTLPRPFRRADLALQSLSLGTVLTALGLFIGRVVIGG